MTEFSALHTPHQSSHTHTHTHREREREVPFAFPPFPWGIGKEKWENSKQQIDNKFCLFVCVCVRVRPVLIGFLVMFFFL